MIRKNWFPDKVNNAFIDSLFPMSIDFFEQNVVGFCQVGFSHIKDDMQ